MLLFEIRQKSRMYESITDLQRI